MKFPIPLVFASANGSAETDGLRLYLKFATRRNPLSRTILKA